MRAIELDDLLGLVIEDKVVAEISSGDFLCGIGLELVVCLEKGIY